MDRSITLRQVGEIRVVACPHPFSSVRIERNVLEGATIRQIMDKMALRGEHLHARVFIDDQLIPSAEWEHATPAAGQYVTIRVVPTGGGGDGGGKDALRLVAMIAVVAAAAFVSGGAGGLMTGVFAGGTVGAAVAGAAVGIGGSLAMNANIPAPLPRRTVPQPIPARALEEAA